MSYIIISYFATVKLQERAGADITIFMEEEQQHQRSQLGTYPSFLPVLLRTSFHPVSFSTWNEVWRYEGHQGNQAVTWWYLLLWMRAPRQTRHQSRTEPYKREPSGLATSPGMEAGTGVEMEVVMEFLTDWPRARLLACDFYCCCRTWSRCWCSPAGGSCWGWWAAGRSFAGECEVGTRSEAGALQPPSSSCKHWYHDEVSGHQWILSTEVKYWVLYKVW